MCQFEVESIWAAAGLAGRANAFPRCWPWTFRVVRSSAVTDELAWLDASAQAALVRGGEVSARELVEGAIARIEALNPSLNAVIHSLFDKARAAVDAGVPDGPFRGVPTVVKDFGATSAGDPYHEGTRFLRDARWTATEDSYLVRRLRGAGCVIVGRTNLPELASAATTEPDAYGPTRNPWDTGRSPGGSSGGSAVAVAAGMVAVAHGTDGGGSIRIPASACGLVGLKPSRGRVSSGPEWGENMGGLATDFMLTRSVRDAAAFLDVLAGPELGDPYTAPHPEQTFVAATQNRQHRLRVGVRTEALAMTGGADVIVHPECRVAVEIAARLLEDLGHRVDDAYPAELDADDVTPAMAAVVCVESARAIDAWSERLGRDLGSRDVDADNWAIAEVGRTITGPAYRRALDRIHLARRRIAEWHAQGFDLLLTPTMAELPPRLGYLAADPAAPLTASVRSVPFGTFTIAFNLTGQPALSLPLHWSPDGLPVGVQLVGAYGREDQLLHVAAQLEQAQPWADKRPPVSAP